MYFFSSSKRRKPKKTKDKISFNGGEITEMANLKVNKHYSTKNNFGSQEILVQNDV